MDEANLEPNEVATLKVLRAIIKKDMGDRLTINEIFYRADYQDYQIIINEHYHCEIREKLFIDYAQHQHPDVKREIVYRLDNLMEFEDWEDSPEDGPKTTGDGMVIEDDQKYDV